MSNNKQLFEQAIADAKSVRDAALANAKKALEESLTPRLQSMLALKLQEMEGEDEDVNEASEDIDESEMDLNEDPDLDEILRELESENEGLAEGQEDETNESQEETNEGEEEPTDDTAEPSAEPDATSAFPDDAMGDEEGGPSDEEELSSLTVGDLKDLLRNTISQELAGGGGGLGDEPMDGDPAQLDEPSDDAASAPEFDSNTSGEDDDVDLNELLRELGELDKTPKAEAKVDANEVKKDLAEAIKCIKYLRKELNEVNLLNAKLLYVNRIFKSKSLTESQKAKIIITFDKANSVKEAKLIYETLVNSTPKTAVKKPMIKESRGFASKPVGIAPKTAPIVDSNVDRWQFLAGIKKTQFK